MVRLSSEATQALLVIDVSSMRVQSIEVAEVTASGGTGIFVQSDGEHFG